jgi:UDP-glucose 4-epimerase
LAIFVSGAAGFIGSNFVGRLLSQNEDVVGYATRTVHLAANAHVRFGLDHPRKDLDQNTIATFNVLEAMRQ